MSRTLTQEEQPTLHRLFRKAAEEFTEHVAIIYDGGNTKDHMVYGTLLTKATVVERFIEDHMCDHEVIGLILQSDINTAAALLGVLLSESAFISIDAAIPVSRLHYLIRHLHIRLLLVHPDLVSNMKKKLEGFCPEIGQVGGQELLLSSLHLKQVDRVTCQSSLAYVISTSGTTGNPKLVKVPHQCIVPNILHLRSLFHVEPADVVFHASPLTFDPSMVEMFIVMTTGAALLLVPDNIKLNPSKMVDILCQNRITIVQATPTLISSIGRSQLQHALLAGGSTLRVLALGGEICPPFPVLKSWRGEGNSTHFYNLYGITEVSCWATCYSVTEHDLNSDRMDVPLGQVLDGTLLEIRGENGEETQHGVLWIGGTERVCWIDNDTETDGVVFRNSGDVVERDSCGQIMYHGRQDEQIKRNGKRLNLRELEQIATCCNVVKQAAAIYDTVNKRLCLIVSVDDLGKCPDPLRCSTPNSSPLCGLEDDLGKSPDPLRDSKPSSSPLCGQEDVTEIHMTVRSEIERLMTGHLPTYYYPDDVVIRETLPMTTHGKVDKKQLMATEEFRVLDKQHPCQANSDTVRFIWKDCLHLSDEDNSIDITSNFLQLGGNSLSALQFVSRVEVVFSGLSLPELLDITLHYTLADILDYLKHSTLRHVETNQRLVGYNATKPCNSTSVPNETNSQLNPTGREESDFSQAELHATEDYSHPTSVQTSGVVSHHGRHTAQEVTGSHRDKMAFQEDPNLPSSVRNNDDGQRHNMRKRKLSNNDYVNEHEQDNNHKELKHEVTDNHCPSVKNQLNATNNLNGLVYSVERGNKTQKNMYYTSTFVAEENISVDTTSVPEETVNSTTNMAIVSESGDRHCNEPHQPHDADDVSDLSRLVVTEIWRHNTGKCVDASPLVGVCRDDTRVIFIGSHSHSFVGLDFGSGLVLWKAELGDRIEGSACLSKCAQFIVVGCYDGCLYVLDAITGDTFWQFQTGAEVKSSPCVDPTNGHVYFGSHDHCLYALDILSQTVVWRLKLDSSVFSSPAICLQPHCLYTATLGGSLTAVSPLLGTLLWRCTLGKPLFSSPVISQHGVVIGCVDGAVYCVSHLGQKLWQHQTGAPVFSSPCVWPTRSLSSLTTPGAKQVVVFGSHDNHIYCIDIDGRLRWKVKVDSPVYSTPFIFHFHMPQYERGQRETELLCQGNAHQTEICHRQKNKNLHNSQPDSELIKMPTNKDLNTTKPAQSGNLVGRTSYENIQQKQTESEKRLVAHTISIPETESTDIEEKPVTMDLVAVCSTRGILYIVTLTSGRVVKAHQFPGEMFSSPVVVTCDDGFDVIVGCRDDFVYCLKVTVQTGQVCMTD